MPNGEDYNTYSSHFILRISMVILRNRRTIITIIRKVKNVHAFRRRWERYTQEVSYIIIQINFETKVNQKIFLNLNVLSIMYLRDIWHDDPLPQRDSFVF